MRRIDLPTREDACWRSLVWRRDKLNECIDAHRLTIQDVSDLTGCGVSTITLWLTHKDIRPGVNTLRLLILELNNRVSA